MEFGYFQGKMVKRLLEKEDPLDRDEYTRGGQGPEEEKMVVTKFSYVLQIVISIKEIRGEQVTVEASWVEKNSGKVLKTEEYSAMDAGSTITVDGICTEVILKPVW